MINPKNSNQPTPRVKGMRKMRISRFIAIASVLAFFVAGGANAQTTSAWKKVQDKIKPSAAEKPARPARPAKTEKAPKAEPAPAPAATNDQPAEVPNEPTPDTGAEIANAPNPAIGGEAEGSLLPAKGTVGLPMAPEKGDKKGKTQINLGKESEEKPTFADLFKNPEVLGMLGQNPRFVYDPANRPDPMIFPPVRNSAIYMELTKVADKFVAEKKFDEALKVYQKILDLKDRRFLVDTRNKMAALESSLGSVATAALESSKPAHAELPPWVRDNTRGILLAQVQPMCLVGDYMLKAGDAVPSYPEVHVTAITKEKVTYSVGNQSFEVPVKGYTE